MDPSAAPSPSATTGAAGGDSFSCPTGPKLRLMCSYGGHIVPRPTDKNLCYACGETRIVAIDRRRAFTLSSLTSHLSKSVLNGRPFSLKYQLPNHDLDSLISISTDEDLANMIDEYDRLVSVGSTARLRFFLFPSRSSPASADDDFHNPTSENWFIDALRNAGVVSKGRSSESVEGQDESDGKAAVLGGGAGGALVDSGTSLPESIVLEKNSSFGSTSSSASTSNSPAIRSGNADESVRLRDVKVVLPTLDSIGSDSSIASPNFSSQAIVYQDAPGFVDSKAVSTNLLETEGNASDRYPHSDLLTPVQVPGYIVTKPMDQQLQQAPPAPPSPPPPQPQYIYPASQSHYVTQYYTNPVPIAPYPPMYQPYSQPQQPVQYQINKPYPMYLMPVGQTQNPYDMSVRCMSTAQNVAPNPHVPSNHVVVAPRMAYEGYKPVTPAPEFAAKVYRTPAVATQPVNNVPPNDDHHQIVAFPHVNLPSQAVAASSSENTNYVSEYEDPMHAQIYKTQPTGPMLPSPLQTANATTALLSEALTQIHVDKH